LNLKPDSLLSAGELPMLYKESGGGGKFKNALAKKLKELEGQYRKDEIQIDRLAMLARAEAELEASGIKADGWREFQRDDFATAFGNADINSDSKLSREEWRIAQRKDWFHIWFWPAIAALVTCALFWVGFRAPPATPEKPPLGELDALDAGAGT
jgi:hypothetical protein